MVVYLYIIIYDTYQHGLHGCDLICPSYSSFTTDLACALVLPITLQCPIAGTADRPYKALLVAL